MENQKIKPMNEEFPPIPTKERNLLQMDIVTEVLKEVFNVKDYNKIDEEERKPLEAKLWNEGRGDFGIPGYVRKIIDNGENTEIRDLLFRRFTKEAMKLEPFPQLIKDAVEYTKVQRKEKVHA